MAEIYEEIYQEQRNKNEGQADNIERIYKRFEFTRNPEVLNGKLVNEKYRLHEKDNFKKRELDGEKKLEDEENYSTELSDPEYDAVYRFYKTLHKAN